MATEDRLQSCTCCGLIQYVPRHGLNDDVFCSRCDTRLKDPGRRNVWSAILALAALILYPVAITLPMLQIEQLGYETHNSLLGGVIALFTEGYWFIGLLVFLCSVVLPPAKLASLWVLSQLDPSHPGEHRARLFRFIEAIGKWSMLDVMLVAVLVAFVKLGDLVQIEAGPGMVAFAMMVVFSLVAGLLFNPHAMWNPREAAS